MSFLVGIAALVLIWLLYPKNFDYPGAITDNVTFYQACVLVLLVLCARAGAESARLVLLVRC